MAIWGRNWPNQRILKDTPEALGRRLVSKLSINEGNDLRKQNYSFVVRVWLESADRSITEHPVWRGSIEQVGNDHRFYFSDLDEITRFIQMQISAEAPSSSTRMPLMLEHMQNRIRKFWKHLFH